jgi:hypothetical protein
MRDLYTPAKPGGDAALLSSGVVGFSNMDASQVTFDKAAAEKSVTGPLRIFPTAGGVEVYFGPGG